MKKPFRLGLTGSIGMGKSTTADMFTEAGIPVWDADETVHRLYAKGGAAVPLVRDLCEQAIEDGAVNRAALSAWLAEAGERFAMLEAVIHPLVKQDRQRFLETAPGDLVVLDIPLLYETGAESECDAIAVVTTSAEEQRRRVLSRDGMSEEKLAAILSRQVSDAEKRARADYIIPTDTLEAARRAVHSIISDIGKRAHA